MKRVAALVLLVMLLAAAARGLTERHLSVAAANLIALAVTALGLRMSARLVGRRAARKKIEQRRDLVRLKM